MKFDTTLHHIDDDYDGNGIEVFYYKRWWYVRHRLDIWAYFALFNCSTGHSCACVCAKWWLSSRMKLARNSVGCHNFHSIWIFLFLKWWFKFEFILFLGIDHEYLLRSRGMKRHRERDNMTSMVIVKMIIIANTNYLIFQCGCTTQLMMRYEIYFYRLLIASHYVLKRLSRSRIIRRSVCV